MSIFNFFKIVSMIESSKTDIDFKESKEITNRKKESELHEITLQNGGRLITMQRRPNMKPASGDWFDFESTDYYQDGFEYKTVIQDGYRKISGGHECSGKRVEINHNLLGGHKFLWNMAQERWQAEKLENENGMIYHTFEWVKKHGAGNIHFEHIKEDGLDIHKYSVDNERARIESQLCQVGGVSGLLTIVKDKKFNDSVYLTKESSGYEIFSVFMIGRYAAQNGK